MADVHLVEIVEVAEFLWEGTCQLVVWNEQVLKIFQISKFVWK